MSLVRNASLVHIKRSAPTLKRRIPYCLDQYQQGASIVQLANETNYSPYLLARYMVEEISTYKENKKMLAAVMKDPEGMLSSIDTIDSLYHQAETNSSNLSLDGEQDGYVHPLDLVTSSEKDPPMH